MTFLQKLLNGMAVLCGLFAFINGIGVLALSMLLAASLVLAGGLRMLPVFNRLFPVLPVVRLTS